MKIKNKKQQIINKIIKVKMEIDQNFEKIKDYMENQDFSCKKYSDSFIQRRLSIRLRVSSKKDYGEYYNFLKVNKEEVKNLIKELSVNVTHFFRDISVWNAFYNELIPKLIENKKRINIWSAGCSSGEEALSIMIQFYEYLGDKINDYDIKIIGTDFDFRIVERAKNAIYEELQFKEMPEKLREKYFIEKDGLYEPIQELKNHITFKVGNLFEDKFPANIDLLFCRNTVIYFTVEAKSKLYEEFYELLNKPGFFVMGKTEILQGNARESFKIFNPKERFYIKE